MSTLQLRLTRSDYARASQFVLAYLRKTGRTPTSLRPLLAIAVSLYLVAIFVITAGPNHFDSADQKIVRVATLALLAVLPLCTFGVWRLRVADAKALQSIEPQAEEELSVSVNARRVRLESATFSAEIPWSATALYVIEPSFAIFLFPRMAPLPLTPAACGQECFLEFIRLAQQYQAHNAA